MRARIRWASALPHDEEEMQYLIDTMAGLLEEAGLAGEAKQLLTEKLAETTAPYYYTGWLAGMEARPAASPKRSRSTARPGRARARRARAPR